jgi:hypothetical protein
MNLQEIIIGPILGSIFGFAVWYFQSRITKLQEEQKRLNDDRRKVYTDILEPFIRIFAGIKDPKESAKALKDVQSFDYKKTAFEFNVEGPDKSDPKDMLKYWGNFLIEVRKSLGNPKTKLTAIDMFRSLIKDIDKNIA